jgi:hypothetical protein
MKKQKERGKLSETSGYPNVTPKESSVINPNQLPKESKKSLVKSIVLPIIRDYSFLENSYRKNELIVTFKEKPSEKDIKEIKKSFHDKGIGQIRVVKCECCCDLTIQLWLAEDIHTVISGKVVSGGGGLDTGTVGESYSLNFLSKIPHHNWEPTNNILTKFKTVENKIDDVILVAVLDTGIDMKIVEQRYVGNDLIHESGECFKNSNKGWNFVDDNDDIADNNPGRHGSLVTQYIINQFKNNPKRKRSVKIIPIKTHDHNGEGNLFNIICAIHYAIAKGAKIINASWGFYNYNNIALKQLDFLPEELKKQRVLFVTAAGNQSIEDDNTAISILAQEGIDVTDPDLLVSDLRDLAKHQFLPACFSKIDENVITVTTTDGTTVASTENYSDIFVDMGVKTDERNEMNRGDLLFKVPFILTNGSSELVGGSSFATAIATGIIGSNMEINNVGTIDKKSLISQLKTEGWCKNDERALDKFIKNGFYMDKVSGA